MNRIKTKREFLEMPLGVRHESEVSPRQPMQGIGALRPPFRRYTPAPPRGSLILKRFPNVIAACQEPWSSIYHLIAGTRFPKSNVVIDFLTSSTQRDAFSMGAS